MCAVELLLRRVGSRCAAFGVGIISVLAPSWWLVPAPARASEAPASIIVKFRHEGSAALHECAEALTRRGDRFERHTADGSASLDTLQRELGVRRLRTLFRRPDGRPFEEQRRQLAQRLRGARKAGGRGRREDSLPDLAHVYRLELSPGVSVAEAVRRYAADPHVAYAQPNYAVTADVVFDDPFLASAGSWGQPYADLWGLERIRAAQAWDSAQGEGVVIAVVDTGVDYEHPDIVENLWVHPGEDLNGNGVADPEDLNGLDDDANGFVDDLRGFDFAESIDANQDGDFDDPEDRGDPDPFDTLGHGTHVAGVAAARGNNGIGISGAAPRARVMPVKIFPDSGGPGETARVWQGVLYAAENGADVINASFSCSRRCPSNPIAEEVIRVVDALGVVHVTSAGNRSDDVQTFSPEKLRETIVVGATNEQDSLSGFSSFGFRVDLVAPGGGPDEFGVRLGRNNILSLKASSVTNNTLSVGEFYRRSAGTSFSTPYVAGAVAVLLSQRPDLTPSQVREVLRASARDLGEPGFDRKTAAGLLDMARMLVTAAPRLEARIDVPAAGTTLTDRVAEIVIRGGVGGEDLYDYELDLGVGAAPTRWLPLAGSRSRAATGDVLGHWSLGEFPDGRYVLRLSARDREGARVVDFAPVSLDRNPPDFVSSPGPDAQRPIISGSRIVWVSPRTRDALQAEDQNLFLSRFGVEGEVLLNDAPGEPQDVAFSGQHVVWTQQDGEGAAVLAGCLLHGRAPGCEPRILSEPGSIPGRAELSGRQLGYSNRLGSQFELVLCALRPAGCRSPWRLPLPGGVVAGPEMSRQRVVWGERRSGVAGVWSCQLDPRTGACPEREVEIPNDNPIFLPLEPEPQDLEGSLLVFADQAPPEGGLPPGPIDFEALGRLNLCDLDALPGVCTPLTVARGAAEFWPDLSGRRLVWQQRLGDDAPDVFYCAFDPVLGRCPVQQLTHDVAVQSFPRIDGHRVVWQDDRSGFFRVAGLALPQLGHLRDRSTRVGARLVFPVRGSDPSGSVRLEVRNAQGGELPAGARLIAQRSGRALFSWKPRRGQVGTWLLSFRATGGGGLRAEQTLRIEVRPGGPP